MDQNSDKLNGNDGLCCLFSILFALQPVPKGQDSICHHRPGIRFLLLDQCWDEKIFSHLEIFKNTISYRR